MKDVLFVIPVGQITEKGIPFLFAKLFGVFLDDGKTNPDEGLRIDVWDQRQRERSIGFVLKRKQIALNGSHALFYRKTFFFFIFFAQIRDKLHEKTIPFFWRDGYFY